MSEHSHHNPDNNSSELAASASPRAQALSLFIRNTIERLQTSSNESGAECGLLFLGNWQDAFPRLLVTDPVLEPVDKLTWQVIRIHVTAPGSVTAFPSYESISNYTNIKSNHTIARALAILRATRWLSLCARVRNSNGRYLGNIYVLHDEPITLGDAMYLDSEYMSFLQGSTEHNHPRVRKIAQSVIATIQELIDTGRDPMGERIHTRSYERRISMAGHLQHVQEPSLFLSERTDFFAISDPLIKQLAGTGRDLPGDGQNLPTEGEQSSPVQKLHTADKEDSAHVQETHTGERQQNPPVQNLHTGDKDDSDPVQEMHSVKNPHTDTRSSSSNKYITTTTTERHPTHARESDQTELHFPPNLTVNERNLVLMYLHRVDQAHQQDVLDEWHGRLLSAERRANPIDNPIGYLAGLCRRVGSGEFQITIGLKIREKRERATQRAKEQLWREEQAQKRLADQKRNATQNTVEMSPIERRIQQIREKSTSKQETQGNE